MRAAEDGQEIPRSGVVRLWGCELMLSVVGTRALIRNKGVGSGDY